MKKWILNTVGRYKQMITVMISIQIGCAILLSLQPRYYQKIVTLAVSDKGAPLLT